MLTIDSFRAVLGNVNDGNVIKDDQGNLKKVNYGRVRTKERTAADAGVNSGLRQSFFEAIASSSDARTLPTDVLDQLRTRLLGEGSIGENLSRQEIKEVLEIIAREVRPEAMTSSLRAAFERKGLFDTPEAAAHFDQASARVLNEPGYGTAREMFETLRVNPERQFNCSKVQFQRFLELHESLIKARMTERLFWHANVSKPYTHSMRTLCVGEIMGLMRDFAAGKVPGFLGDVVPAKTGAVEVPEEMRDYRAQTGLPALNAKLDALEAKLTSRGVHAWAIRSLVSQVRAQLDGKFVAVCQSAPMEADARAKYVRENFTEKVQAFCDLVARFADDVESAGPDCLLRVMKLLGSAVSDQMERKDPLNLGGQEALDAFAAALEKTSGSFGIRAQIKVCVDSLYATASERQEAMQLMSGFLDRVRTGGDRMMTGTRQFYDEQVQTAAQQAKGGEAPVVSSSMKAHVLTTVRELKAEAEAEMLKQLGRRGMIAKKAIDIYQAHCPNVAKSLKPGQDLKTEALRYLGEVWETEENLKAQTGEEILAKLDGLTDEEIDFTVMYFETKLLDSDKKLASAMGKPEARPIRDYLRDCGIDLRRFNAESVDLLGKTLAVSGGGTSPMPLLNYFLDGGALPGKQATYLADRLRTAAQNLGLTTVVQAMDAASVPGDPATTGFMKASSGLRLMKAMIPDVIPGFPASSHEQVFEFLAECSIPATDLHGGPAKENLISLQLLAQKCPTGMKGLAEFCERVTGKGVREIGFEDVIRFMKAGAKDAFTELKGASKTVAEMLTGSRGLSELKLPANEVVAYLEAMKGLSEAPAGTKATVTLAGKQIEFEKRATGSLSATVDKVRFHVEGDAAAHVAKAQDELVLAAKDPAFAEALKGILPEPGTTEMSDMRLRELCIKTLVAKLDAAAVKFASVPTAELRSLALRALDGNLKAEEIRTSAEGLLGQDSLEMKGKMEALARKDPEKLNTLVKMPARNGMRDLESRQARTEAREVHNLVADLLVSGDLGKLVAAYGPELANIVKDTEGALLATLPAIGGAKEEFAAILQDLASLSAEELAPDSKSGRLQALQDRLDAFAETAANAMQDEVNRLFAPTSGDDRPIWQKTFAEINGQEGLDLSTVSGNFASKVLQGYFTKSGSVDKRRMISELLRNTDAKATPAKCVAELLKGAGPLLQKILQGLPIESFGPETREALMDMKSRLPPIPEELVKAQMLDLIDSSNGKITSVEVKKSLGAASVGQAFLCNIKTKDHPVVGIDCVVKVLRPNAANAVQREKALIDSLVDDRQRSDFASQYAEILKELDLTLEAGNVRIGMSVYEKPLAPAETAKRNGDVHSMQLVDGIAPTMGAMVVKLAPGQTVDGLVRDMKDDVRQLLTSGEDPIEKEIAADPEGPVTTTLQTNDYKRAVDVKRQIIEKVDVLRANRKHLVNLTASWFEEAVFRGRFFQADMHGGNIMMSKGGVTVIDFGNCRRLTEAERTMILKLLVVSSTSSSDRFLEAISGGLPEADRAVFGKKTEGAAFKADLKAVLEKGTSKDVLQRLQCGLTVIQRQGLALPPALTQFIQSFVRLSGAVSAYDEAIQDLGNQAAQVKWVPDAPLGPLPEGVDETHILARLDGFFKACARDFGSEAGDKRIDGLADELRKVLDQGGLIDGFAKGGLEAGLELLGRFEPFVDKGQYASTVEALKNWYPVRDNPNAPERRVFVSRIRQLTVSVLNNQAKAVPDRMLSWNAQPFDEVVSSIVFKHQGELQVFAMKEFGFSAFSVGRALVAADDASDAAVARVNARLEELREANEKAPEEVKLTETEVTVLARCAKNLCRPTSYKVPDDLLDILEVNLARLEKALPKTAIGSQHVKFLFELAAAWEDEDRAKTVIGRLQALDEKSLTALQVDPRVRENPSLEKALSALFL